MRIGIAVFGAVLTSVCIAWALEAPSWFGTAFFDQQLLALVAGLALCIVFLTLSWRQEAHRRRIPWFDSGLAIASLVVFSWTSFHYERLLSDVPYYTPEILWLGGAMVPLVLEGLRRCTGWALFTVVVVILSYALIAEYAPMFIRGKSQELYQLSTYLAFDTNALLGSPIKVGAEVVILFLLMGDILIRSGGGDFFLDLARSLLGRKRGGPAKMCVVASGLFGVISGSAVGNVAAVGQLTIPLMIRSGYKPRDAGAIEAVGSTGGQLMPPVMGAAAFLMAEFLAIPYSKVAVAAAIPAVLYYLALYWQVDLLAAKDRIAPPNNDDLPRFRQVLKDGWHFVVPLAALFFVLFHWESSPELAAIIASVVMLVIGMVRGYRRSPLVPIDVIWSLVETGRNSASLVITLAAAGLIIGVLNTSGLGFALTIWLVNLAGSNLFILLVITAVIALILGMGMPTTGVYILLAVLAAPALVQAGVTELPAHMFVLYFGLLSMITPPVALAAYAAAAISKAGPMETGWAACRIGWAKFILPFMFVLSPTLLMQGTPSAIALDAVTAVAGIYGANCGMVGYFLRPLSLIRRALLCVGGFAAIFPDSYLGLGGALSLSGVALGAAILLLEYLAAVRRLRSLASTRSRPA